MIVAVLQARMRSTRLPGKVLAPVAGRPMLARQLERIFMAHRVDRVTVATTDLPQDDAVARCALDAGAAVYRGEEADVLERFWQAAKQAGADHVVRLTGDCPLMDPQVIDRVISVHLDEGNDCTANVVERTFPDGLDVEVATFAALDRARTLAGAALEREHVTPFFYRAENGFRIGSVLCSRDLGRMRWTVDYPEDLDLVREIYDALEARGPDFSMWDVVALLESRPELRSINASRCAAPVADA